MPRGPLSQDHKARMQNTRKATAQAREAAITALGTNGQFTQPKFWATVASEVQKEVVRAIRKAQRAEKKVEMEWLKARIAELEADV